MCVLAPSRLTHTLPTSCPCLLQPHLAVDFGSDCSLKLLLTELTGAGFDPSERCCVVAEGLLPFLSQVGGWVGPSGGGPDVGLPLAVWDCHIPCREPLRIALRKLRSRQPSNDP